MIAVPASIQTQLGDAIGVIADSDFWERWDTLVDVSLTVYVGEARAEVLGPDIPSDTRQSQNQ